MVGFKEEFTDRIIGANPHLVVQKSFFTDKKKINNEEKDTLINKVWTPLSGNKTSRIFFIVKREKKKIPVIKRKNK